MPSFSQLSRMVTTTASLPTALRITTSTLLMASLALSLVECERQRPMMELTKTAMDGGVIGGHLQ